MAIRPAYLVMDGYIKEEFFEFEWHPGMSVQQKQKSIREFHKEIKKKYPEKNILEISTKSESELGKKLSAFNLSVNTERRKVTVEMLFQSCKVFEKGGPFLDILDKTSLEAKKDIRLKESGSLVYFLYKGSRWELYPKTAFYDWIYINMLQKNCHLIEEIVSYDCFTDIEFNPQKSINCQARSAALFVVLYNKDNGLSIIGDKEVYLKELPKLYKEETPPKPSKKKNVLHQLSLLGGKRVSS